MDHAIIGVSPGGNTHSAWRTGRRKESSARESVRAHRFGWFLHFVSFDEAAAFAAGMWKAAFCEAFQARRAERGMPFQISLLRPPSAISTANCRIFGIFLGFSPSNGRWESSPIRNWESRLARDRKSTRL